MLGRGNLRNPIGQQLQFTSDKLKEKEEGRNRNLKSSEMKNYRKMRKEQEKNL